jgi:hypothetical protein
VTSSIFFSALSSGPIFENPIQSLGEERRLDERVMVWSGLIDESVEEQSGEGSLSAEVDWSSPKGQGLGTLSNREIQQREGVGVQSACRSVLRRQ